MFSYHKYNPRKVTNQHVCSRLIRFFGKYIEKIFNLIIFFKLYGLISVWPWLYNMANYIYMNQRIAISLQCFNHYIGDTWRKNINPLTANTEGCHSKALEPLKKFNFLGMEMAYWELIKIFSKKVIRSEGVNELKELLFSSIWNFSLLNWRMIFHICN